jgi:hypothetical protein
MTDKSEGSVGTQQQPAMTMMGAGAITAAETHR